LREYIAGRHGWLFPVRLDVHHKMYTTVRRLSFRPKLAKFGLSTERAGLHCYRRFRAARLREQGCSKIYENIGWGTRNQDMSDHYAEQLLANRNRRQEWARKVGLGFEIPATWDGTLRSCKMLYSNRMVNTETSGESSLVN